MKYANITGWGECLPPSVLTNDDLSTIMDTSDEWIYPRTGIKARRISHVSTSDLATLAGRRALACAGLEASNLDGIILATATPDNLLPSAASAVQRSSGPSTPPCLTSMRPAPVSSTPSPSPPRWCRPA